MNKDLFLLASKLIFLIRPSMQAAPKLGLDNEEREPKKEPTTIIRFNNLLLQSEVFLMELDQFS